MGLYDNDVAVLLPGVSFATLAEKEIIECIVANTGLLKISVNLRLPEGRHKVENATLRNGEYKRVLRREAARKAAWEAEELAKNPVEPLGKAKDAKEAAPKSTPAVKKPPPSTTTKPVTSQVANPTVSSTAKERNASLVDKKDTDKWRQQRLLRKKIKSQPLPEKGGTSRKIENRACAKAAPTTPKKRRTLSRNLPLPRQRRLTPQLQRLLQLRQRRLQML
ncbi:hypothetical protein OSTOST_16500 [Ostertagia ostertagi]